MKYNLTLSGFADESDSFVTGQIAAMQRNGIRYIEPRGLDGKSIGDITLDEAKEFKKRFDEGGISVSSLGSPLGKTDIRDDFAPEIERCKRLLEIAQMWGTKYIRMFSFYGTGYGDYRDEVMERIAKFVEIAKGSGVILCHENEKGIYGEKADACLEILKTVPGLRAVFDPANFVQAKVDTLKAWEMLSPYVEYCHIKDALPDETIVPVGMGIANIKEIMKLYGRQGGGFVSLEPHLSAFVGLEGLEAAGHESKVGKVKFASREEAFDSAANTMKALLNEIEQEND